MRIVTTIREMQAFADAERAAGRRIGFVPTMGCLHEGHLSLVHRARKECDAVVVSIFVNPTQFDSRADFERYPRDEARDIRLLAQAGVDVLFLPPAREMYPQGFQTRVEVARLTQRLCGEHRPGHFAGVATVVAKLFLAVKPHVAIFGAKDYQQLQTIRRLVEDLNFDLEVRAGETVREADGLAMSSRNARLTPESRERSRAVARGIEAVRAAVAAGERDPGRLRSLFAGECEGAGLRVEYADVCDPDTLEPLVAIEGRALFAVAVWAGEVRLIDNVIVEPPGEAAARASAGR